MEWRQCVGTKHTESPAALSNSGGRCPPCWKRYPPSRDNCLCIAPRRPGNWGSANGSLKGAVQISHLNLGDAAEDEVPKCGKDLIEDGRCLLAVKWLFAKVVVLGRVVATQFQLLNQYCSSNNVWVCDYIMTKQIWDLPMVSRNWNEAELGEIFTTLCLFLPAGRELPWPFQCKASDLYCQNSARSIYS